MLSFVRMKLMNTSKDDLSLFKALDEQIQGVLDQINYIAITLQTNKKVPVEDMPRKIKKALQKIKSYLSQDPSAEQEATLNANQNQSAAGGIQLEKNPLIDDLGGMPLESISSEWQDLAEEFDVLDKAELENLVKNKLKDKLKNRERLANRLKIGAKPQNAPKPGAAMTPKFQETLKYILKEMPAPPAPVPRETPLPRPRPF